MEKQKKCYAKTRNLKYPFQHRIKILPCGSYSTSDIQDHFEYILKNTKKRLIILQ